MYDPMPLATMKTYRGVREVPTDFDDFWDGLLQAHQDLPPYTFTDKAFGLAALDCKELRFKGDNGSEIYARCIFPQADQPAPVIFYFHGYQGQSPDWSQLLPYTAAGYGIVAMDVRGQAGQSRDNGQFAGITVKGHVIRGAVAGREHLFYKDVYLDVWQLTRIVAAQSWVDETNLQTYGGSQGGALALVAAALNPAIQQTVAIYPFLSDFDRLLEIGDSGEEPYNEFYRYFKFSDPFHDTEDQIMQTLQYIDVKNMAHRLKQRVHLLTGLADKICFPSTQFAIYNRLGTSDKTHDLLPEYGHEDMHVLVDDHAFNWLCHTTIDLNRH